MVEVELSEVLVRWFLKTKADLELNGNSFGGHFLDTTTPLL